MPVSPSLAENLAASIVARYSEAERLMLERIARNLAKGIDGPHWAEMKLSQMRAYRAQTEALLRGLQAEAAPAIEAAVVEAYQRGGLSAVADLKSAGLPAFEPLAGLRAAEALAQETVGNVLATHPRILRVADDVYRSVVAEASQQVLLGTQTRLQAAQAALDRFALKGVTGFVDKAGRGWTMESYTEMAVRTGAGHAAVQGHTDRLQANGIDLVIVSDAPRECPACRQWEGKVLTLGGGNAEYESLDDARAGGLFHPGCRHSISAYQEGITPPTGDVADPAGYAATEKLRRLEREVRASKRLQAAAMDDGARRDATRRLNDYRAKIRHHVATTSAKRQPHRERLGAL